MNVILTGYMGAGKTTAINHLYNSYYAFDIDNIIENFYNQTIRQIFLEKGEKKFREIESLILECLISFDGLIIATGGGTLHHFEKKFLLKKNCKIIFLYAPLNVLWERVKDSQRPLAKNFDDFEIIYMQRVPTYFAFCDFFINTEKDDWLKDIKHYISSLNISTKNDIMYYKNIEQILNERLNKM